MMRCFDRCILGHFLVKLTADLYFFWIFCLSYISLIYDSLGLFLQTRVNCIHFSHLHIQQMILLSLLVCCIQKNTYFDTLQLSLTEAAILVAVRFSMKNKKEEK